MSLGLLTGMTVWIRSTPKDESPAQAVTQQRIADTAPTTRRASTLPPAPTPPASTPAPRPSQPVSPQAPVQTAQPRPQSPSTEATRSVEKAPPEQHRDTHKGWKITFLDSDASDANATTPTASGKTGSIKLSAPSKNPTAEEITKHFRQSGDKEDALFLARYYYDKHQYNKALNWALETNKIDNNIEESWLIFGKAKAKLGQRIEAIRVLQAYCDRSGSKKGKKLLEKVRKGEKL